MKSDTWESAVHLHEVFNWSAPMIAQHLNVPVDNVEDWLREAQAGREAEALAQYVRKLPPWRRRVLHVPAGSLVRKPNREAA